MEKLASYKPSGLLQVLVQSNCKILITLSPGAILSAFLALKYPFSTYYFQCFNGTHKMAKNCKIMAACATFKI
jgi:hypothetical protein